MPRRSLLLPGLLLFALSMGSGMASPAAAQSSPEAFEQTDLDKNGRIDREEYKRRMVEVFYFADKDKDGVVTISELQVIETVEPKAFGAADRSDEGKLTVTEFVTYRMIQFDEADTNKDGVLTREEVEAWRSR